MMTYKLRLKGILNDLETQGLAVKYHDDLPNTWFIHGQGGFLGYLATGDELIELKRIHRLSLRSIKNLP